MAWPCFMLEKTDRHRQWLRRYDLHTDCPNAGRFGMHQAWVQWQSGIAPPKDDPAWPTKCDNCEYAFTPDKGSFTLFQLAIYRAHDGREFTLRDAPVGAMYHGEWIKDSKEWNRANDPNGPLHVILPNNWEWNIDGPASNGDGWTRTGTPPLVTVTPSIAPNGYHGYLTNGVLTDDIDGRTIVVPERTFP